MLTFTPFFVIVFLTKIIPPRGVVIESGSEWIFAHSHKGTEPL